MVRALIADVLLCLAVAIVAGSSIGILVMRDAYQKLHYVTPAALVTPVLVGLAVLVRSGWSLSSLQTGLTLAILIVVAPFLSHATMRVARIRDAGDWKSGVRDTEPGARE